MGIYGKKRDCTIDNYKKREIPWKRIIQFHKEITHRAEENFFTLPLTETNSERWSRISDFHPENLSGPWLIKEKSISSQQLVKSLRSESPGELFLSGPCWSIFNKDKGLCWQPLLYREVRVEFVSEGELKIVPEQGSWDLSPPFFKFLETKEIQLNQPLDNRLHDLIEKVHSRSKIENKDITICLIEEFKQEIPELGTELIPKVTKGKEASSQSSWILFTAQTTNFRYQQNLSNDYDKLEKQLEKNPKKIGGLKLFEDVPVDEQDLFRWEEVPGNDSDKFIDLLRRNTEFSWVKKENIEKINDGNTIYIPIERNSINIKLNRDKNKAFLTFNENRIAEYDVKIRSGLHYIYTSIDILPIVTLNASQREAVSGILKSKSVSVISGPPGCGKSQVVVSLLLNAWAKGISVLFASTNNKAVDVVRERLERFENDYPITVRAGTKNNNVEEILRRTLNIVAASKKSSGFVRKIDNKNSELILKKNRLQDWLESQIPQRVDQEIRSALKAYGEYQSAIGELNSFNAKHIKEIKEFGYDVSPDVFSINITKLLRVWLEKITTYNIKIEQDSNDKSNLKINADRLLQERNIAVQRAGLNPNLIDNWNWLISGPGFELLENWFESYKSFIFQPHLEQWLTPYEWDDKYNDWIDETDAINWNMNAWQLSKEIMQTCNELSSKVAEIEDIRNQYEAMYRNIVKEDIPGDIQIKLEVISEWMNLYSKEHSLPRSILDWSPLSQRKKLLSRLHSIENEIRSFYPPSLWRKIGEINEIGREKLSDILELTRKWILIRNGWNELKNNRDQIDNQFGDLARKANELKVEKLPAHTDLSLWFTLAGTIKEKAKISEQASIAWKKRTLVEQTKDRLRGISLNFQSIAAGLPIKEEWIKNNGYAFSQSVLKLGNNPVSSDILAARTEIYKESINQFLTAWRNAKKAEIEMRKNLENADKIPSKLSRITEWWNEKPPFLILQRNDFNTFPEKNDYLWNQLKAFEDRDERWKSFTEKTMPKLEKRCNDELNWAIDQLKKALETVPEGQEKLKISQIVQPILNQKEKVWPADELFQSFAVFRPEIIKSEIEAIDGELEILSLNMAKDNWLSRLAEDSEVQNSLEP